MPNNSFKRTAAPIFEYTVVVAAGCRLIQSLGRVRNSQVDWLRSIYWALALAPVTAALGVFGIMLAHSSDLAKGAGVVLLSPSLGMIFLLESLGNVRISGAAFYAVALLVQFLACLPFVHFVRLFLARPRHTRPN